jgi:hypothetical protein
VEAEMVGLALRARQVRILLTLIYQNLKPTKPEVLLTLLAQLGLMAPNPNQKLSSINEILLILLPLRTF